MPIRQQALPRLLRFRLQIDARLSSTSAFGATPYKVASAFLTDVSVDMQNFISTPIGSAVLSLSFVGMVFIGSDVTKYYFRRAHAERKHIQAFRHIFVYHFFHVRRNLSGIYLHIVNPELYGKKVIKGFFRDMAHAHQNAAKRFPAFLLPRLWHF
jgi:hypothetical protein